METGHKPSYVVGVGASAGGLEALEKLFGGIRPDTGLAFVVVQHLSPDFKSMMDELLSRHTQMTIHRVEDGMLVEPNSIYLIPPKKEMIISEGRLLLTDKDPGDGLSLPIDTFFRSLARDVGKRSIAVVLSGSGSDGSRGVKAVHEVGGLVAAQTEESAAFDSMPRSAMDTGYVDLTLQPEALGTAIAKYVANPKLPIQDESPVDGRELSLLFKLLNAEYGIDFSWYKRSTVGRRIERRLVMQKKACLADYVQTLRSDPAELNKLYKDLLIGVTKFFRDPPAFERLAKDILPRVLANTKEGGEARFWVAGCATGEEAYSFAILLREQLATLSRPISAKIFATDIHQASLDHASAGYYDAQSLSEISPDRLKDNFVRIGEGYQVSPELRKLIVFAPHNLIKDAPFTRIDAITCRNMLIYLEAAAQQKVISLFHFALRSGGTLLLGPSETPGDLSDEFETLDNHWKLYRKRRDVRLITDPRLAASSSYTDLRATGGLRPYVERSPSEDYLFPAFELLTRDYSPPSFLVDKHSRLLYTFAGASQYLKRSDGAASTSLLDMVDEGFRVTLSGAIQRAEREKEPVTYSGVELLRGDKKERASVTIKPFRDRQGEERYLISLSAISASLATRPSDVEIDADQAARERLVLLEADLQRTKENLQATIEELETSNEELQATNEELVASNEELQNTNEELHSVNEELYTVNAEHQLKIDQLSALTEDMERLLKASDSATVFLDEDLCIRRSSLKAQQIFNILETDIGRPIEAFNHRLLYAEFVADIRAVLSTKQAIEKEVVDQENNPYLVRINSYHIRAGRKGALVTLVDLSLLKEAATELAKSERRFRGTFDNAAVGIAHVNLDGSWLEVNERLCEIVGYSRKELLSKTFQDITHRDDVESDLEQLRQLVGGDIDRYSRQKRYVHKNGKEVWINLTVSLQRSESGEPLYCISVVEDITPRKQFERELQKAISQRDHFLATLSHELRNPLAALLHAARLMDRRRRGTKGNKPLDVILRQSQQMSHLLDDLLDVSRVTQGKIILTRQPADIRSVANEATEAVKPLIEAKSHELVVEMPDTSVWAEVDRTRMRQVIENLLTNAAKYTPNGGTIRMRLQPVDGEAVVEVVDSGCGISEEMLTRVFDMFVQTDENLHDREGGMGLGLTLVRSLVLMHSGSVTAHSEGKGRGSTFTVCLPLIPAPPADQPTHSESPTPRGQKRRRLVLVEDEQDAREMLSESLRLDGYEVTCAGDGHEALAAIVGERPDVALIDIALPGMSGMEVAKQVRKSFGSDEIYLVALTGYGRASDREATLAAGFDEHLVKPVRPDDLERVLTKP